MSTERNPLLSCRIATAIAAVRAEPDRADALWSEMRANYATTSTKDPQLEAAIAEKNLDTVAKIVEDWDRDRRPRPLEDRELLKKAMKAFRKRLKLTRLDDESRLGVGAMTKGSESAIVGITPPSDYARPVWAELARQGRLGDCGDGLYCLVEDAGGRKGGDTQHVS